MSALPDQPEHEPVHLPTTGSFPSPAAATGGGAKSHDAFDWSSKPFSASGSALPSSATLGGGARPEGRSYELPPNPFVTASATRPSSPASGGSAKPEKLKVDISVTTGPAGKTQGESPSDSGKPGRPTTELPPNTSFTANPPPAASATPGGAKPGKVHVEASVDIEPPATGTGGPAAPPHSPPVLTDMQLFQESQKQNMQMQLEMQRQNSEMQVFTAQQTAANTLTTARAEFIKQGASSVEKLAPG